MLFRPATLGPLAAAGEAPGAPGAERDRRGGPDRRAGGTGSSEAAAALSDG